MDYAKVSEEVLSDLREIAGAKNVATNSDELENYREYYHKLDPLNPDSDSDLLPDGWEVANNLDPAVDDSLHDTDIDGLTNYQEFVNQTDPQNSDTDIDGIPDLWEIVNDVSWGRYGEYFRYKGAEGLQRLGGRCHPGSPDNRSALQS